MEEEEALSEQQKKRKDQVQFEAQYYTEEDWDAIRAKLEANAELTKDVLGKDLPEQDFAKRMVDMVNQRKKHFTEEIAKAKRNKPMTQSQLRIYMSNYLKNQGTWKLSQLKKLSFEEIKKEFDKLVQRIDTFGSEMIKWESCGSMNPTPLVTKSNIVNWKIFQQGQRSVYQIMRANGADTVYMSLEAMLMDFQKRILIVLYRLVMRIHCLTLEASTIYMLADRKYPLSKDACQVMLKIKLLDGTMDEVCNQLLKMIKKQVRIRK
ncbi:hypothetical protein Tco_0917804 [Tanacetum coccineum]